MKPSTNKLRGGSNSALTALKNRCVAEFNRDGVSATMEKIQAWSTETVQRGGKDSTRTNAELRQLIGEFFQIQLSRDTQLSSFWSWVRLESKTREREMAVQQLLEPDRAKGISDADLNAKGQRLFKIVALAEEDPEAFARILSGQTKAAHKERELNLAEQKFAETKKSEQQKALEYCLAEAKGTPAEELFTQAFVALKKARAK